MDIGVVSMRYARALLQFAERNKDAETVYAEMQALARSYLAVPQLRPVLLNPTLPAAEKQQLLVTASAGEKQLSVSLNRFFELVISRQRVDCMQFIANSYLTLYQEKNNLTQGRLITACPVSADTVERMKSLVARLTQKDVRLETVQDPTIEGGFILEYGTYRMDVCLKSRLAQIRRKLETVTC